MTSESTRFLGQPNEIKPTVGAVGVESLLTFSLYREWNFCAVRAAFSRGAVASGRIFVAGMFEDGPVLFGLGVPVLKRLRMV
jgi:hypothetical protein